MKKIVVVSGGFDPLHVGHLRNIKAARALGDELIVILNTDEFLRQKKGYVFMPFAQRRELLLGLKYIDHVVRCLDRDQTVAKTLAKIKPAIFAKGGDRNRKNLPPNEIAVCQKYNIKIVSGIGGRKVQSSSWLVADVVKNHRQQK